MRNFFVYFNVKNAFKYIFLTGAVLKPPSSNIAQHFLYILLDLCEFFSDFKKWCFVEKKYLKHEKWKKSKKLGYIFFDRYFHIKNYGEDLRHHRQILIELSRNAPYGSEKFKKIYKLWDFKKVSYFYERKTRICWSFLLLTKKWLVIKNVYIVFV